MYGCQINYNSLLRCDRDAKLNMVVVCDRSDHLHADGQHSLRCGGGRVHGPPQRAHHPNHTHLCPLSVIQTHRRARRSRDQGNTQSSVY